MKKALSILLVLLLAISCVFAYQKTYRLSSDEVQTFLLLRKASGSITPDPSYPVSASQLVTLLHGIDSSKLTGKYAQLYEDLLNDLENPMVYFGKNNFGMDADLSILGIQALKSLDPSTYKILPAKDRTPLVDGKADIYFGDYAYGMFDGDLRIRNFKITGNKDAVQYYTLKDIMSGSLVIGSPFRAFASMGFENYNLIVGRDRLGSGNGYTGNLELGENSLFEDFAKLSFINDWISYDFVLESFNHNGGEGGSWDISPDTMKKNIFIHRISFDIEERANFSFYEGALIWEDSPFANLQYFNPFMFLHNYGTYHDASTNNFMGLEIMTNVFDGIQIDAQVFFDQLNVSFVEGDDTDNSGENAFEILVNVSKSYEVKDGILDLYAEGVYGNPYAYLKNNHGYGLKTSDTDGKTYYTAGSHKGEEYDPRNTDLILDMPISDAGREFNYLGYKYGGDLKSIAVGAIYRKNGYKLSADLQYLAKGQYGIAGNTVTSGTDSDWNYVYEDYEQRVCQGLEDNIIQHTIMANFGFDGPVYKGIDLSAKLGLVYHLKNYHHESGNDNVFDLQYSVGITVHPDKFMRRAVKKAL